MNRREAAIVLSRLSAAWPRTEMPEASALTVYQHLAAFEVEDAVAAVDELVKTSKFMPSISELVDQVHTVIRRRHMRGDHRALPTGEPIIDRETATQRISDLRDLLARTRTA